MHFDGSAIDGFSRVQESDVLAKPDPNSFELLPWAKGDDPSARMFCDILNLDGTPSRAIPARCCKRNLDRAREQGFSFYVAPEMEFFYFGDGDPSQPPKLLDTGSYFDLTTADVASDLRKRTIHMLEAMGIPVEYSFHEDAPEPARDRPALHRRPVDGRQRHDLPAGGARDRRSSRACTPRSCPSRSRACRARACTPTCRCSRATTNAFHEPGDPYGLSKVARGFIAGLLRARPRDHRGHQPDWSTPTSG